MALSVGVDVGGTKIAAGVVDDDGRVLDRRRRETAAGDPDEVIATVVELVRGLAGTHDVAAVGVGCAGLVDPDRSVVRAAPNLRWRDVPLRDRLTGELGLPVVVENDANAMAWGEHRFGAGRGHPDLIAITVGTGIGGGIVIGGELYRGHTGAAAEVGHLIVEREGRACPCGARGCWEQYASGRALVRTARELASPAGRLAELARGGEIEGEHVTAAAQQGDPEALAAFAEVGQWLGLGLASLVAVLDHDRVVVGGGVGEAGELLLGPTRESFLALSRVAPYRTSTVEIVPAELGNDAGLVGAADLAR